MDNDILYEYRYPRSGTLRCLAMLVGDTPIPGKIRSRSFVNTPYGVAFNSKQYTLSLLPLTGRPSALRAEVKDKDSPKKSTYFPSLYITNSTPETK